MPISDTAIVPLGLCHTPAFLDAAGKEGWLSDPWEFTFLMDHFPSGCFVALHDEGPVGYVTASRYGKSGWIGNLLVAQALRGQGIGTALLRRGMQALQESGVTTMWLTASPSGQPLYERHGFTPLDRIIRWRAPSRSGDRGESAFDFSTVEQIDRLGWGESRREILRAAAERSVILSSPDGFCFLQVTKELLQLGPWGCRDQRAARPLLLRALSAGGRLDEVVLDVPEGNPYSAPLLTGEGFSHCGATTLMWRGAAPSYAPRYIYALASMGSMG